MAFTLDTAQSRRCPYLSADELWGDRACTVPHAPPPLQFTLIPALAVVRVGVFMLPYEIIGFVTTGTENIEEVPAFRDICVIYQLCEM